LTVRHKGVVAIGATAGHVSATTIMKADAVKIRRLMDGKVITASPVPRPTPRPTGTVEAKLKDFPSNVPRAATELAKEWRTDRVLPAARGDGRRGRCPATLLVTGNGDVVQPTDGILGIGWVALCGAAARALVAHSNLAAPEIVPHRAGNRRTDRIIRDTNIVVEESSGRNDGPGDRGGVGPAHRRAGCGEAGRGRGRAQPLAPPAPSEEMRPEVARRTS
jgi:ATP-dependent HslUV protease subunit HslV